MNRRYQVWGVWGSAMCVWSVIMFSWHYKEQATQPTVRSEVLANMCAPSVKRKKKNRSFQLRWLNIFPSVSILTPERSSFQICTISVSNLRPSRNCYFLFFLFLFLFFMLFIYLFFFFFCLGWFGCLGFMAYGRFFNAKSIFIQLISSISNNSV